MPSRDSAGNDHRFLATMFDGGLEGLASLAAAGSRHQHRCTAPTERTPSSDSASNDHRFLATMIGSGLEMRALAAVAGRTSTPLHGADGADARQGGSASNGVHSWWRCSRFAQRSQSPLSRPRQLQNNSPCGLPAFPASSATSANSVLNSHFFSPAR